MQAWTSRIASLLSLANRLSLNARFAILSLFVLIAGLIIIGTLISDQITQAISKERAAVTSAFVTSAVAPHLQGLAIDDLLSSAEFHALDDLLIRSELGSKIVSFKVWSIEGRILYSPSPELVGEYFPIDESLERALRGETVAHISELTASENAYERALFQRLIETYAPLRRAGSDQVLGVVEFYETTSSLERAIGTARDRVWLVMIASTITLYGLFFALVRTASRTMSRQQANLNLAEAERRIDRLKSNFISSVTHELRTPLGLIKGYVTTLQREGALIDDKTRTEFLSIIDEESENLQKMVDDLLDSYRVESGSLSLQFSVEKLDSIVTSAVTNMSGRVADSGLRLRTNIDSAGALVHIDPGRIRQVIYNLIDNAAKYSGSETTITVGTNARGGLANTWVRDEGPGIPEMELEKVFEPFYRADKSSRRLIRGAGLGLAISKAIVEAHGGKMWAEHNPNRGAIFNFSLPVQDEMERTSSSED